MTKPAKDRKGGNRSTSAAKGAAAKRPDPVFETLRQRLAKRELLPGSKLRENELAREFGVSRTRIREVLGVLEQRGLIERIPNQGAVVARLDLRQIENIFDVRMALEGLCIRRATANAPPEVWKALLAQLGPTIERELSHGEFENYIAYLNDLRRQMLHHAGNSLLTQMLDLIYDKAEFIARRVLILPGRWEFALGLHRALLKAMIAGDADEAELIRRKTLASAYEFFKKYKDFVL